jgi:hypothetical protein
MAMAECGANLILTPDQLPHGLTRRATPLRGPRIGSLAF